MKRVRLDVDARYGLVSRAASRSVFLITRTCHEVLVSKFEAILPRFRVKPGKPGVDSARMTFTNGVFAPVTIFDARMNLEGTSVSYGILTRKMKQRLMKETIKTRSSNEREIKIIRVSLLLFANCKTVKLRLIF